MSRLTTCLLFALTAGLLALAFWWTSTAAPERGTVLSDPVGVEDSEPSAPSPGGDPIAPRPLPRRGTPPANAPKHRAPLRVIDTDGTPAPAVFLDLRCNGRPLEPSENRTTDEDGVFPLAPSLFFDGHPLEVTAYRDGHPAGRTVIPVEEANPAPLVLLPPREVLVKVLNSDGELLRNAPITLSAEDGATFHDLDQVDADADGVARFVIPPMDLSPRNYRAALVERGVTFRPEVAGPTEVTLRALGECFSMQLVQPDGTPLPFDVMAGMDVKGPDGRFFRTIRLERGRYAMSLPEKHGYDTVRLFSFARPISSLLEGTALFSSIPDPDAVMLTPLLRDGARDIPLTTHGLVTVHAEAPLHQWRVVRPGGPPPKVVHLFLKERRGPVRAFLTSAGEFVLEGSGPRPLAIASRGVTKIADAVPFEIPAGPGGVRGTLTLPPLPLLCAGRVTNDDGTPATGATVSVMEHETHTDADGWFRLAAVQERMPAPMPVRVRPTDDRRPTLFPVARGKEDCRFELRTYGWVRIRVMNAESLRDLRVTVSESGRTPDAAPRPVPTLGRLRVETPQGEVDVTLTAADHDPVVIRGVRVPLGGIADDRRLQAISFDGSPVPATVTVTDPYRRPVAGAHVTLLPEGPVGAPALTGVTDETGSVAFPVEAGTHRQLEVVTKDGLGAWVTNPDLPIAVQLARLATVRLAPSSRLIERTGPGEATLVLTRDPAVHRVKLGRTLGGGLEETSVLLGAGFYDAVLEVRNQGEVRSIPLVQVIASPEESGRLRLLDAKSPGIPR